MSCYPMQFPAMVAENKTVHCALKFKVTTKGIWNASEDKLPAANIMVKPPMPVNLGKRSSDISLDAQRWKKHKVDISKDKSCRGTDRQRDRVSIGVSKPPEANVSVKSSMLVNSGKRRQEASFDDHRWMKQSMDSNLKLECMKILKGLMNHSYGWVFCEPVDPVKLKIPDYFEIIKNPMDLGTIKHKLEGNMYSAAKEFADDVKLTFENAMLYNPSSDQVHRWAEVLDDNFSRRWKLLDAKLKTTNKNDEVTRQFPENNHQVMKPVGLMKAPAPEKLGNSRRISLEERQKSRPCLMQLKPGKTALNGCLLLNKSAKKEHCVRRSSASVDLGQSIDIKLDCEVKSSSTSLAKSIALDSDGRGVGLNEENPCSTSATTPASIEGWIADVHMSPKKALRVAMLKSRFADTIFKATHPTLVDHDEKSDPSRMQQERLRLEKEQLKEKARIEAQIKAAEEASRRKKQDNWKLRREIDRKAARMALDKIVKSVEIDRSPSLLKDIDILFGGYPNPKYLEQIGLFLKNYMEEDEAEEGEIL